MCGATRALALEGGVGRFGEGRGGGSSAAGGWRRGDGCQTRFASRLGLGAWFGGARVGGVGVCGGRCCSAAAGAMCSTRGPGEGPPHAQRVLVVGGVVVRRSVSGYVGLVGWLVWWVVGLGRGGGWAMCSTRGPREGPPHAQRVLVVGGVVVRRSVSGYVGLVGWFVWWVVGLGRAAARAMCSTRGPREGPPHAQRVLVVGGVVWMAWWFGRPGGGRGLLIRAAC